MAVSVLPTMRSVRLDGAWILEKAFLGQFVLDQGQRLEYCLFRFQHDPDCEVYNTRSSRV